MPRVSNFPVRSTRGRAPLPYNPSPMVRRLGRAARIAGTIGRVGARFIPGVGQAAAAMELVEAIRPRRYRSGQRMATTQTQATSSRKTGGARYRTLGRYRGKFKRTKRVRVDVFRKNGVMNTMEVHGTVSDPNCVYIGHSTYSGIQLLETMLQAMLKKLFYRAGVRLESIKQVLPGYESNTSNCWKMILYRENKATGVIDTSSYTTVAGTNTSIYQLVGDRAAGTAALWPGLFAVFEAYAIGQYGAGVGEPINVLQPAFIRLYRAEDNVANFWQYQSEIVFGNEHITCKSKSQLKIQNRSLAADASADSADVSNNPIVGKQYLFNSGCPRARSQDLFLVEAMLEPSGVLTARSAQFAGTVDMSEPPPAGAFWNCLSSSGARLEPGDIKKQVITHYKKMRFLQFLKSLGLGYSAAAQKQINLIGKSGLFAFEDVINVNASQNISIAYEVNREFGCYFTSQGSPCTIGVKYDLEVNNNPT
nr:putative capsid protein [Cressdnaviricota sp.]